METAVAIYESQDLAVNREPAMILSEATKAAKALNDVVAKKKKKVVFNGEQYLEFEDLQTLGRFYGVTAKVVSTQYIEFGEVKGFEARAVVIRADGAEISAADAMCLNDEANWKKKPLFQLRSMAQTRACAKAFRNVLAWVVVLAGYKPTPAEEMQEVFSHQPPVAMPTPAPEDTAPKNGNSVSQNDYISPAQAKRMFAIAKEHKWPMDELKAYLFHEHDIEHSNLIPRDNYEDIIAWIECHEGYAIPEDKQ